MKSRFILVFLIVCLFGYLGSGDADVFAQNKSAFSSKKTIFSNKDLVVPQNQTIDHIVEIGSDVTLSGSVREIIVIGGNLHITKTAHVDELVIVLGGTIVQESGARVTDEVFHVFFSHQLANSLLLTSSFLFGWWFFRFSVSLLLFLLPIVAVQIAKNRIDTFITTIRSDLKRLLLIGAVTSLLLVGIASLLLISVIGIPFLIILGLILFYYSIISLTVISMMIGEQILLTKGREKWLLVAGGSAIFASAVNFPFLGVVLLLGLHWLSLGLMTTGLWKKRRIGYDSKRE